MHTGSTDFLLYGEFSFCINKYVQPRKADTVEAKNNSSIYSRNKKQKYESETMMVS